MRRALSALLFAIFSLASLGCAEEREKRELELLRKMQEQTPSFPGLERAGNEIVVTKSGKVSLSNAYKSKAEFTEIRQFYDHLLTPQGWVAEVPPASIFVGEQKYVYFKRGEYSIAIAQVTGEPNGFHIAFEWIAR